MIATISISTEEAVRAFLLDSASYCEAEVP